MPRTVKVRLDFGQVVQGVFNPATQMLLCDRGTSYHRTEIKKVLEGSLD